MKFSTILKVSCMSSEMKGVDVFCKVNGKPTNADICDQMLEGEKQDPEVTAGVVALAKEIGFSDEDAKKYWG